MACYMPRRYTRPKTVTHPGTNRARRALTSFMRRTPLTTTPRAALCRVRHFEGRKHGILKIGRFWRIGVCIAERIRRVLLLLRNYTPLTQRTVRDSPRQCHRCNHKNIDCRSDWLGGNKTFAPGGKHPRAATASQNSMVTIRSPFCGYDTT